MRSAGELPKIGIQWDIGRVFRCFSHLRSDLSDIDFDAASHFRGRPALLIHHDNSRIQLWTATTSEAHGRGWEGDGRNELAATRERGAAGSHVVCSDPGTGKVFKGVQRPWHSPDGSRRLKSPDNLSEKLDQHRGRRRGPLQQPHPSAHRHQTHPGPLRHVPPRL